MSKKILIVEDDGNIRELLRLYLEREGYEITEASNGEEGVDVVVCDFRYFSVPLRNVGEASRFGTHYIGGLQTADGEIFRVGMPFEYSSADADLSEVVALERNGVGGVENQFHSTDFISLAALQIYCPAAESEVLDYGGHIPVGSCIALGIVADYTTGDNVILE